MVALGAELIDPGAMRELGSAGGGDAAAADPNIDDAVKGTLFCACVFTARRPIAATQASCKNECFMFPPLLFPEKPKAEFRLPF